MTSHAEQIAAQVQQYRTVQRLSFASVDAQAVPYSFSWENSEDSGYSENAGTGLGLWRAIAPDVTEMGESEVLRLLEDYPDAFENEGIGADAVRAYFAGEDSDDDGTTWHGRGWFALENAIESAVRDAHERATEILGSSVWPVRLPYDMSEEVAQARIFRDAGNVVLVGIGGSHYLALTCVGMDLTYHICAAYAAVDVAPPFALVSGLSGGQFCGMYRDSLYVRTMAAASETAGYMLRRAEITRADVARVIVWQQESIAQGH